MSMTPQQAADAHLLDLRTKRRDILDDYVRTDGVTDWCYTEEELTAALEEDASDDYSAAYLEALKIVFESLRALDGVKNPPPALT